MRILAFSDLHCDLAQGRRLAEMSAEADVVVGAGDFASVHEDLEETVEVLSAIERPTVLIPGNNETEDELLAACARWAAATVLHGDGTEIEGVPFYGLGAGVPITPWDWSFDLDESQAGEMLAPLPTHAVLVVHSPPSGHVDTDSSGRHLGSQAILDAIEAKQPKLAVCGHIHESWGRESAIGSTPVRNLGPSGTMLEVN
jgi:Icc-related predicted phosphoesterase